MRGIDLPTSKSIISCKKANRKNSYSSDLAVDNRFQSNLVKSILRPMGVLGGAAKLNQDDLNSIEPDAVECLPPMVEEELLRASAAEVPAPEVGSPSSLR